MSSGLYSGQPGLSLGVGLYRAVSGLWSGASGLTMAFGGAGMTLSLDFTTQTYSSNSLSRTFDQLITFTRSSAATRVNASGLVESVTANTPRFDYDPVTLAPKGLLVEEQRTNLLVRSEEFDNAAWTKTAVSVVANAATSPDGTVDADRLIGDTTATGHILTQVGVASAASGTTYTASVYLKAEGYGFAFVALNGTGYSTPQYISVNLSTGATAITNGTPTAFAAINSGNGWWRVIVTATTDVAAGTVQFDVRPSNDGVWANRNTAQNGTSGIFLYGAQLEAGAFATSYIPCVASQVTRTADIATITGANFSQWYNQSEGTFVVDWTGPTAVTVSALGAVSVSDGTINERVTLRRVNVSNDVGAIIVDNNVVQANLTQAGAASGANKAAIAYRTDDVITAANGTLGPSDTSATMPTVTQLEIGFGPGITYLNGHIRSLRFYPTRLSNAQLQALTA